MPLTSSKAAMTDDSPKARTLANGIEVWCSFDKLVPVGELKPNPRNPNTHPQRQIELLAENIRYFGWRQNITVSNLTGYIVSGHGRLMAAKHLGVEVVPLDYQDFASENDELAVLVADSRLAELATVDLNKLEKIASEWQTTDFDTILAGFEPATLRACSIRTVATMMTTTMTATTRNSTRAMSPWPSASIGSASARTNSSPGATA
jgi:hypothetical protein